MFNLDPGKLIVIAVVAIILLGPDKLPQVGRQVGAAWRSFTEFRHRMEAEVRSSLPDLPPTSEIARLARSPSALLQHLSTMSDDEAKEPVAPGAEEVGQPAEAREGTVVSGNGATANGDGSHGDATAPVVRPDVDSAETVAPAPTAPRPPETVVQGDPNLN